MDSWLVADHRDAKLQELSMLLVVNPESCEMEPAAAGRPRIRRGFCDKELGSIELLRIRPGGSAVIFSLASAVLLRRSPGRGFGEAERVRAISVAIVEELKMFFEKR